MDIRQIFKEVSVVLGANFRKASQAAHNGGKGTIREEALRQFLEEYLPSNYSVGQGEIISSENRVSGQLDIIIYDGTRCPAFIRSSGHSIFPIECVYGAISIKSHLDSSELADAYHNIVSAKRLTRAGAFSYQANPATTIGMSFPNLVGGIFAYASNRSMDSIRSQILKLDEATDLSLQPDFVTVLNTGLIAPNQPIRTLWNERKRPIDNDARRRLSKLAEHTLLKFYTMLLRELNTITLPPFDLADYENMPSIVGAHRVRRHDQFRRTIAGESDHNTYSLSRKAIDSIVENSKAQTVRDYYLAQFGNLPEGVTDEGYLNQEIRIYNPRGLPNIIGAEAAVIDGVAHFITPVFQPSLIEIDGQEYAIDANAIDKDDYEINYSAGLNNIYSE